MEFLPVVVQSYIKGELNSYCKSQAFVLQITPPRVANGQQAINIVSHLGVSKTEPPKKGAA